MSLEKSKNHLLIDVADRLHKLPMFRLSLSSNELFHSNFLAWLSQHIGESSSSNDELSRLAAYKMGKLFCKKDLESNFEDFSGKHKGKFCVKREKNKLDLSFYEDDRLWFAVELKIKSWPTMAQLEKYTEKQDFELILLSLFRDDSICIQDNLCVSIIDFSQYVENLSALAMTVTNQTSQFWLVNYIEMCNLLNQFADNSHIDGKTTLADIATVANQLEFSNLNAIYLKFAAARLRDLILSSLKLENFKITAGFSRGKMQVHGEIEKLLTDNNGTLSIRAGVQIEGDELRMFLAINADEYLNIKFPKTAKEYAADKLKRASTDKNLFYNHARITEPDKVSPSKTLKKGERLTGYNNSSRHGFSDYRYKLDESITLDKIVEYVKVLMLGDKFHAPNCTLTSILNSFELRDFK